MRKQTIVNTLGMYNSKIFIKLEFIMFLIKMQQVGACAASSQGVSCLMPINWWWKSNQCMRKIKPIIMFFSRRRLSSFYKPQIYILDLVLPQVAHLSLLVVCLHRSSTQVPQKEGTVFFMFVTLLLWRLVTGQKNMC